MDWIPVIEKRDAGNGCVEYRPLQDNNTMVAGRESTIVVTLDVTGGLVRLVGRSWQEIRRRLQRLADKVDDDWTPQGVALSIEKILAHEDTEDTPAQHKRRIEDAFREGWEEGWGSCRHKAKNEGTINITYSADEFDPDWDSSQTKRKLDEEP